MKSFGSLQCPQNLLEITLRITYFYDSMIAHTHQCTAGSHDNELCNLLEKVYGALLRPCCKVVLHQDFKLVMDDAVTQDMQCL